MAESSQFSPLNTLSDQLGPNSWVSSVFIPAFIANIGKYFFLKYDQQSFKSIQNILFYDLLDIFFSVNPYQHLLIGTAVKIITLIYHLITIMTL